MKSITAIEDQPAREPDPRPPRRREVVVINRLPAGQIARAGLVLIGLGLGFYFLWRIQEVLFLLFLAILLATAIEPIVNRLRRGPFTRGSGVLVVYTAIVIAIALPVAVVWPNVTAQASAFTESLPGRIAGLRPYAEQLQPRAVRDTALNAIDRANASLRNPAAPQPEQLVEVGATAAHWVVNFVTIFVLAFYWLVERARIKRALLRLVPARRAKDVNAVWVEVEEKLGGWVRGQLILMLAVGVAAGIGFFFIGLPNWLLLAVAAALLEMIPLLGPVLAFAPAVLVALAIDPVKALIVVAYAVVVQQIEGNVLVPRVLGRTVGISPLTVLLGILIGAVLYGLPGALVAVPLAAALQVILAHSLRMEDPGQAEAHPRRSEREEAMGKRPDDVPPAAERPADPPAKLPDERERAPRRVSAADDAPEPQVKPPVSLADQVAPEIRRG